MGSVGPLGTKPNDKGEQLKLNRRVKTKLVAGASALTLVGGLAVVVAAPASAALAKVDVSSHSVTCNDVLGKIKFSVPLHLGGTTANQVTIIIKSLDCVDNTVGVYDADTNPGGVSLKSVAQKGVLNSSTNDCLGLSGYSTSTSGSIVGSWATNPATPGLLAPSNKSTITVTQTFGGTTNITPGAFSPTWSSATNYATGDNVSRLGDSYTANYANLNKAPETHRASYDGVNQTATNQWLRNGPDNILNSWGANYAAFQIGTPYGTTAATVTGGFNDGGGANLTFTGTTGESKGSLANACFSATGIKGITFAQGGFTT